jgi:hypothetical protein
VSNPAKRLFLFWYQEKSDIFPDENSSKGRRIVLPTTRLFDKNLFTYELLIFMKE